MTTPPPRNARSADALVGLPGRRRRAARVRLAAFGMMAAGAAVMLVMAQLPANALVPETPSPVTGNATWFSGLGGPYGGCGMTQDALETQNFIALNVYNAPGTNDYWQRPLPVGDPKIGMWNNGHNCGRWVRVTIADYCTGVNDGALGQPFCRNGSWVSDAYNGATLDMIVADSCGDNNAWCRDDPYHIDLNHASLNKFVKNGTAVGDMDPDHWNNRHVTWQFIPAPNYSGDIQIGFLQGAQTWWAAIAVSHLANGMHGIQYYADGAWGDAVMDADMGQAYIIKPLLAGGSDFSIRVLDATDTLINSGRIYSFSLPTACSPQCTPAYQKISYTTSTSITPTTQPTGTSSGGSGGTGLCTATYQTGNTWPGGFQGEITVKAGTTALRGWTVSWTLASGQSIRDSWNSTLSVSGSTVTAKNVSYNGSVPANGSTTFGFIGNGSASTPTLTCSSP